MRTAPIVEIEGLRKSFGVHEVLRGVDLRVEPGEVLALLGRNGAGKTTLVNILATLMEADSGSVRVAGADTRTRPAAVRAALSLTGQFAAVDGALSARENLVLMGRLAGLGAQRARARAAELLADFGLESAADRRVNAFSGGMKRRVDIACALVRVPQVLILDEPTTGLDPGARAQVWGLVEGLVREGMTILLTTQYLEEADVLADRIVVLDGGVVAYSGTATELKATVGEARLEVNGPAGRTSVPVAARVDDVSRALCALRSQGHGSSEVGLRTAGLDEAFLALITTEGAR